MCVHNRTIENAIGAAVPTILGTLPQYDLKLADGSRSPIFLFASL